MRDESDADIRLIIEPRSRNVEPAVLMESLFKLTDLETRFPLNLNVLDKDRRPGVMGLRGVLAAYLDHQRDVLAKRTQFRLAKIDDRLELLGGYLIAYLNIDEVIRIIREADEPRAELVARFALSERQAEAVLNLRLRSLRKLEEIEIRTENEALIAEAADLRGLLASPERQRDRIKADLARLRLRYGPDTLLGARRTEIADAPPVTLIPLEAMIDKEPLTVIVSAKFWVRAMKGHADLAAGEAVKFKEGDGPGWSFHAQTTDRIVVAAANGRFYTLAADRLPGGRGFGEPLKLMIDLDGEIVSVFAGAPATRYLVAASDGRGFIVSGDDLLAETRKGRQVMTPREGAVLKLVHAVPPQADALAVVGDNRKLLVVPLDTVPAMARGQGVALQKYKDGGLSDATAFVRTEGLSWTMGGAGTRTRTETDLAAWEGARGGTGRLPPQGFPRDNKF